MHVAYISLKEVPRWNNKTELFYCISQFLISQSFPKDHYITYIFGEAEIDHIDHKAYGIPDSLNTIRIKPGEKINFETLEKEITVYRRNIPQIIHTIDIESFKLGNEIYKYFKKSGQTNIFQVYSYGFYDEIDDILNFSDIITINSIKDRCHSIFKEMDISKFWLIPVVKKEHWFPRRRSERIFKLYNRLLKIPRPKKRYEWIDYD